MPRNVYVIDVTETRIVRKKVTATSEKAAFKKAEEEALANGFMTSQFQHRTIASWPAAENEETEIDLGNGYRVRRGWFHQVVTTGGKYGHGDRTISFTEAQTNFLVERAAFDALLEKPERSHYVVRLYGWAATYGEHKTWSRVYPTHDAAYKSTRRFVEEQKQFDRDRNRRQREIDARVDLESTMDATLVRMLDGDLQRLPGGFWKVVELDEWYVTKPIVDELLLYGEDVPEKTRFFYVQVLDRMNQSGDPRVLTLTPTGRAYAAKIKEARACLPA